MKKVLVTGSSGLIGSEVCLYFAAEGWKIHGIDNNQRAVFFAAPRATLAGTRTDSNNPSKTSSITRVGHPTTVRACWT